jgi:cob(I)alamin adenosyltransferase
MTKSSSLIHVARTICRRAERAIITFYQDNKVDETKLEYINRLSDLLYIMALNVDKIRYKNEDLN